MTEENFLDVPWFVVDDDLSAMAGYTSIAARNIRTSEISEEDIDYIIADMFERRELTEHIVQLHNAHVAGRTEYYIRSDEGATFYVETLKKALEHLMGPHGYRLTISDAEGSEIIIRRTSDVQHRDVLGESIDANVRVRFKQ